MLEFATSCASVDRALQYFLAIVVGICIISWDLWLDFALIIVCGCLSGFANSNQKTGDLANSNQKLSEYKCCKFRLKLSEAIEMLDQNL